MSQYLFVRPTRAGLKIREDFGGTLIPDEGARVKASRHIARRIAEGDLVVAEPPSEEPDTKVTKKSKTSKSEGE